MFPYYSLLILLELLGVHGQQRYYTPSNTANVQFGNPRRLENPNVLQEEEERFFLSGERDRYQLPVLRTTEPPEATQQRRFQQEIADSSLREQQRLSLGLPNTVRVAYDNNNNYVQGQSTGPVLFNPQQETLYSIFNQEPRNKRKGGSIVFPRSIDYWRGALNNISETATLLTNLNKLKSKNGVVEIFDDDGQVINNNTGEQYGNNIITTAGNNVIDGQSELSKYNAMEEIAYNSGDDLLHQTQSGSQSNNMTDVLSTLALFVKVPKRKNVAQTIMIKNQPTAVSGNEIIERNNRKVVTGNKNELRSSLVYRTPPGKKIEKDFGYHPSNNVKRMGVFPNILNRSPMISMLHRLTSDITGIYEIGDSQTHRQH